MLEPSKRGGEEGLNSQDSPSGWKSTLLTSIKFYTIGAIGMVVQLAVISVLVGIFKMHYLLATFLGVEAAIIQNYIWHEKWTWADRASVTKKEALTRLMKFNLTTGAFSLIGNLLLMKLFVGFLHFHYFIAQIITIGTCAILNFLISHHFVFKAQTRA
jgi:dolichol-phosphate mannosyltransferase